MGSIGLAMVAAALSLSFMLGNLLYKCCLAPKQAYQRLLGNGSFRGPKPSFPLGNLEEMKRRTLEAQASSSSQYHLGSNSQVMINHDIHSSSLPYFSHWQKLHGKVFIYWMGTEPFLYIAEPEFIKQMSREVVAKQWGKPAVFRSDRIPMFGESGLNMIESHDWIRHRHIITPAFSPSSLRGMSNLMMDTTKKMIDRWNATIDMATIRPKIGEATVDVEKEMTALAGEIIAKTNFGIEDDTGKILLDKLRAMQTSLFKHTRYVGVPFGSLLCLKQTLEAWRLGKEVDDLLLTIIDARRKAIGLEPQHDLLGLLIEGGNADHGKFVKHLTTRELIDECKTFFFGGHETVALSMTWTLLLLAMHPQWQDELREEIRQVIGDKEQLDFTLLAGLKKMGWVMNEVLRLYPSSPNVQRQARNDIKVGDAVIPNGTNIWIDVVGMHHDQALWGDDVNEFKPERFREDLCGGCRHKMGYLPYGFGGRMCIGRNYAIMEYKIVLSLLLPKFSFSPSPDYRHSPTYFFSFRPKYGVPLVIKHL